MLYHESTISYVLPTKEKKNPTHGIWEEPRLGKTAIGFQKPSKLHTLGF